MSYKKKKTEILLLTHKKKFAIIYVNIKASAFLVHKDTIGGYYYENLGFFEKEGH